MVGPTESIILDGGMVIRVDGRPAQGTRHEVLFGVLRDTGERVVVKMERIPGALDVEHRALSWLTTQRGPAPRLIAASSVLPHGRRAACLVTQRAAGAAP